MIREFAPEEHYHIYNRGISKQAIFHDNKDYYRFLFLILYFQSKETFPNISRHVEEFVQHPMLHIADDVLKKRTVELISFCIMPNHFHLLVREKEERGISSYMQRVLNSYSKYYNAKYDKTGHVFQGAYKAIHVDDDIYLKHLSAYIHRNPIEIPEWRNRYEQYPWSSYMAITSNNYLGELIVPEIILGEGGGKDYKKFVKTSPAKSLEI